MNLSTVRAAWMLSSSPVLASMSAERRALNKAAILAEAEVILARIKDQTGLAACFALEQAALNLQKAGALK